ncbi:MAG: hypothetical protein KJO11_07010 [Gemmatimonadetes bacterium]|nr:hypothetical protein [Gemmatimonadota bacterium]NNF37803.1 hypothetical protein [Gemmatimonadota bacterium]NNK62235.1 hypothetical protein [Gemmatimonadota bacterium]
MLRSLAVSWIATTVLLTGCASSGGSDQLPILDGTWDMSATIDGVVYIGMLTFAPDRLVIWDGDLGQRNLCEATPRRGGGGYWVSCPVRMEVIPNDEGELVATVFDTVRREGYYRRCLRHEERSARIVCVEWEVTPREEVERRPRRIRLLPTEGATVRWPGEGGGPRPGAR